MSTRSVRIGQPAAPAPGGARRHRRRPPAAVSSSGAAAVDEVRAWLGSGARRADLLIEHLHTLHDRAGALHARHLGVLAAELGLPLRDVLETVAACGCFHVVERACAAPPGDAASGASDETADAAPDAAGPIDDDWTRASADAAIRQAVLDMSGLDAYCACGGYRLLKRCIAGELDVESVLQLVEAAGLRGLGGAGCPTAAKWRAVRGQPAPRALVVEVLEPEPGSFKDRLHLALQPHRLLEGALIAAWAAGVSRIVVLIRHDAHTCRQALADEVARLRGHPPYLGMPDIELRRGVGRYDGAEPHVIAATVEGRAMTAGRGDAQRLQGQALLVHNFETLYWLPELIEQGSAWFLRQGRRGGRGLRFYSLSGRVNRPGVACAPAGISLQELIDEHGGGLVAGHRLQAFLPGGAGGGVLPAALAGAALDFDALAPHGGALGRAAVVVLSDRDDVVSLTRPILGLFLREGCGRCPACDAGRAPAEALVDAPCWQRQDVEHARDALAAGTARCLAAEAAGRACATLLRHFPQLLGSATGAAWSARGSA